MLREFIKMTLHEGQMEDHLRSRGVDPEQTYVIIDEKSGNATFLLYNLSGQLVGFQQYNPAGSKTRGSSGKKLYNKAKQDVSVRDLMKYFTFIGDEGDEKKIAVWGLETLDDRPYVFVTEGIFDAIKIHNAGYPAIAVLANRPKPLRPWFKAMGKHVIAIMDDDDAGSSLSIIADEKHTTPGDYNDLGDMPQAEVDEFLSTLQQK